MSELSANLVVAAAVLLTGVSMALGFLGFVAWRRVGHGRLLGVALAFSLFGIKGVFLAQQAYTERGALAEARLEGLLPTVILFDLAIVLILYFAAWKR